MNYPKLLAAFPLKGLLLFAALVLLGSCSKFQRAIREDDPKKKFLSAMSYYDKKDYYRAGLLFEDLLPSLAGTPEAEKAQFYYANCHFKQEQYLLSSHYFKTYSTTYGRSEFAEQAAYMHAYSLYRNTPDYNLDQSNTATAIDAMQDFINRYPSSSLMPEANKVIDELRGTLEQKGYEIAKQYQRLRNYKAAVVAYQNFQKEFPDSRYREEMNFLILDSRWLLAKNSVPELKEERLKLVLSTYIDFLEKYPAGTYLKQAELHYASALKELEIIKKKQANG
jgi:outer membrane protein assembly factor BamD